MIPIGVNRPLIDSILLFVIGGGDWYQGFPKNLIQLVIGACLQRIYKKSPFPSMKQSREISRQRPVTRILSKVLGIKFL